MIGNNVVHALDMVGFDADRGRHEKVSKETSECMTLRLGMAKATYFRNGQWCCQSREEQWVWLDGDWVEGLLPRKGWSL